MCAFYGLIASEVTHVHRNCVGVFVRACVRVRVHAHGWTGVRMPTRRKQYTNASLFYI